jgi:hypothetical protein
MDYFESYSNREMVAMHRMALQHWQHRMDRLSVATTRYQAISEELNQRGL